jgi:biopolymer transport protein ExbD
MSDSVRSSSGRFISAAALLCACASRVPPAPIPTVHVERVDSGVPVPATVTAPEQQDPRRSFDCSVFGDEDPAPSDPARVFVTKTGVVCFGGERTRDDADVQVKARAFVAQRGVQSVHLFVDGSIPYSRVISLMDALRQGGLDEVQFAVRSEGN